MTVCIPRFLARPVIPPSRHIPNQIPLEPTTYGASSHNTREKAIANRSPPSYPTANAQPSAAFDPSQHSTVEISARAVMHSARVPPPPVDRILGVSQNNKLRRGSEFLHDKLYQ
ncbi:hypothetical protein L873DRAFT_1815570 [Choiromyces venosus 120613-1]|uniref:Uncharacterized protein n=1 Tax=Choiromyces venosus 120613-1 TaxID=1336337 RepID=A0A3N4J602_9PEZI|nr:hypothetical protein L873DRAFT_1815570 [Choiromyces venosus 120613-1]